MKMAELLPRIERMLNWDHEEIASVFAKPVKGIRLDEQKQLSKCEAVRQASINAGKREV